MFNVSVPLKPAANIQTCCLQDIIEWSKRRWIPLDVMRKCVSSQ